MKAFIEIIKMQFKVALQYKWAFAITLIIHPIMLLINIALFKSIYAYNHTNLIKGYNLTQMIWYFTAVGFVYALIWNFTDLLISDRILTGNLAVDLIKPISLFQFELASAVGSRLVALFCEFIPGLVLYGIIFFPHFMTAASLIKFIILVSMAFILYYLFCFLLGLSTFLIKNNTSIISIRTAIVAITGGGVLPLEFYPNWANKILNILPFKYIFYWPVQIFLNKESTSNFNVFLQVLITQLIWILVMYLISRICWKKVIVKFSACGG
jgi:ABC-2 type transport system permease protein